ncbi:MAG: hypothetical protein J1F32_07135 [Erysipelotrichales bacterium]|nr:hypothetical protein [Erysipelotrichales bacterium]
MNQETIITLIGLFASVSSIVFAILAFKRSERHDHKKEGKNEGLILADIGYIKACVDRMEKNLTSVDERYRKMIERLTKVEEDLMHVQKRLEEMAYKKGG